MQDDDILSVGGGITVSETEEAIQGAQDEPITGYVIADDDDERGGADPDAPEGGAANGELTPRQQQRRQQKARRNFTRQKVDTLEKTVEQLQHELHALRQGGMATQATLIDNEIARLKSLESGWGSEYERAIENNDGAQARIALDYQNKAAAAAINLAAQKQQLVTQAQQQAAPANGTGDIKRVVTAFANANPWFDPRQDEKSNQLARMGATLEKLGLSPASEDYWDELSLRAERKGIDFVSPFAGGDDDDEEPQRQPRARQTVPAAPAARRTNSLAPTGGRGDAATAGGAASGTSGGTFTFTKAHLEQLRLAGVDTSNRAEMTKWAGIFKKSARG